MRTSHARKEERVRGALLVGLALCVGVLAFPTRAQAQGFTPQKDAVWMKLGLIHSWADQQYAGLDEQTFRPDATLGELVPFRARQGQVVGGNQNSQQLTLDLTWAPFDRGVVGAFVPLLMRAYYHNDVNDYTTTALGPGDVNLFAGVQLTPRDQWRVGSTLYVKAKIPTQFKFPYANEALRSEGQLDLAVASGNSLKLIGNSYLNAVVEYRHRFAFKDGPIYAKPGDEVHLTATLGGGWIPGVWLSAGYTGLIGFEWDINTGGLYTEGVDGQTLPTERVWRRRIHSAMVSAYITKFGELIDVKGAALDVWFKLPFAGQDHANSRAIGLGFAFSSAP